jgi:hypothetical protein
MRSMLLMNLFFLLVLTGCGQVSKTTIYNDSTYDKLAKAENIRIKHIDGREFVFYRMEVMKQDVNFIYARCWVKKKSEPVDYKFNKQDIVIESTSFSSSMAANYFMLTVITVGIIILVPIILSKL